MKTSLRACSRSVSIAFIFVFAFAVAVEGLNAQQPNNPGAYRHFAGLQGILADRGSNELDAYTVELQNLDSRMSKRIAVLPSGQFNAGNVEPGVYRLAVMNVRGVVIRETLVNVSEATPDVEIEIGSKDKQATGTGGTVSLGTLKHAVPKKALKEYERSIQCRQNGDSAGALDHLKKAIAIDPGYLEAHNNLGARYLEIRDYESALPEITKALELDPDAAPALQNMAILSLWRRSYGDAEMQARRALRADPALTTCRFIVGMSLAAENKLTDEALDLLRDAAVQFPAANILAAQILAKRGDVAGAEKCLRAYLKSGSLEKREMVAAWVKTMDLDKSATAGKASSSIKASSMMSGSSVIP